MLETPLAGTPKFVGSVWPNSLNTPKSGPGVAAAAAAAKSGAKHLLDHVSRHAVEEERNEYDQQEEEDDFEDEPSIVVPQDVTDRLERIQEPDEGRIRPTAAHIQQFIPEAVLAIRPRPTQTRSWPTQTARVIPMIPTYTTPVGLPKICLAFDWPTQMKIPRTAYGSLRPLTNCKTWSRTLTPSRLIAGECTLH